MWREVLGRASWEEVDVAASVKKRVLSAENKLSASPAAAPPAMPCSHPIHYDPARNIVTHQDILQSACTDICLRPHTNQDHSNYRQRLYSVSSDLLHPLLSFPQHDVDRARGVPTAAANQCSKQSAASISLSQCPPDSTRCEVCPGAV